MQRRLVVGLIAATVLGACGSVKKSSRLQQQLYQPLLAGPGDLVLRIDRQSGRRHGRKNNDGFSEIRFAGIDANGDVLLYRRDVQVLSTRGNPQVSTTFSTTNASSYGTASAGGHTAYVQGTGSANTASTTISAAPERQFVIPSDAIIVRVSPDEKRLPMEGYLIEIFSANRTALRYQLLRQ